MYNYAMTGQRLNPQQRADILGTAGRIAAQSEKAFGDIRGNTKRRQSAAV